MASRDPHNDQCADAGTPAPRSFNPAFRRAKAPRSAVRFGWGILNPYGDLWTYEVFHTAADARKYVEDFWRPIKGGGGDLRRFAIVKVRSRTSAVMPLDDGSAERVAAGSEAPGGPINDPR